MDDMGTVTAVHDADLAINSSGLSI